MRTKLHLLSLFLVISTTLMAQDDLPSDTFRVVKEYQPILIDADKIVTEPEINDTFKLETELDYSFINKQVPVSFEVEPISAARIKGEPLVKLYNGYARAGVGNAMLPFGEVYYANTRSKKFAAGAHAKYFHQKELSNIEGSEMSKAHFEVFGKRFWKRNTVEGKLGYDLHKLNYYGYYQVPRLQSTQEFSEGDLEQQYDQFSADFKIKSTKQDSFNLRHEGNIHYHMLQNASSMAENQIKGEAKLSQFVESELYQLEFLADYNAYEDQESGIFAIKPQISTIGEKFRVNAGLGIYLNAADETDFHFYPIAEVKYNVVEDILVPYIGVKGEIERNSYQTITQENPFVAENIALGNSNQKYNLYAGLRGTLSSDISFNTSAAYINTENDYLYMKDGFANRVLDPEFYLAYDNIDELQIKGELVYRMNEKLKVYALGEYFNFETENQEKAWHRPDFKVSVSSEYNLRDKIIARAEIFYWGQQYARGVNEVIVDESYNILERRYYVETLAPIVDVSLGFEYRYTKKLSAFIDFNNLGGINYEKYQDYPLQGFNVWGGLTYGF